MGVKRLIATLSSTPLALQGQGKEISNPSLFKHFRTRENPFELDATCRKTIVEAEKVRLVKLAEVARVAEVVNLEELAAEGRGCVDV